MSDRIANLKDAYGNSIKISNEQVTSTTGGQALIDDPSSGITVHGYTQTGIDYVPATTLITGQTYHIIVPAGADYGMGVNSILFSSFSNINTSIVPITRSGGSSGQGLGCSFGEINFMGFYFLNSGVQTCYQCLDGTSTSSFEADVVYSGDGEDDDPKLTKYFYVKSSTTVASINNTGVLKCTKLTDGTITKTMTQVLSTEVPTNMVTTDTTQTITGTKTFNSSVAAYNHTSSKTSMGTAATSPTVYASDAIKYTSGSGASQIVNTLSFPAKSGTFAMTSDIPSLTNYVTTNTTQTISGEKTFSNLKAVTSTGLTISNQGNLTLEASEGDIILGPDTHTGNIDCTNIGGALKVPNINNGTSDLVIGQNANSKTRVTVGSLFKVTQKNASGTDTDLIYTDASNNVNLMSNLYVKNKNATGRNLFSVLPSEITIGNSTDKPQVSIYNAKLYGSNGSGIYKSALYTDPNGVIFGGTHYMHKLTITKGSSSSTEIFVNLTIINTSDTTISSLASVSESDIFSSTGFTTGGGYYTGFVVGVGLNITGYGTGHYAYYVSTNSSGTVSSTPIAKFDLSGATISDTVIPMPY